MNMSEDITFLVGTLYMYGGEEGGISDGTHLQDSQYKSDGNGTHV